MMNPELRTVEIMIGMYCRSFHGGRENLCTECAALLDYARERIAKCPFGVHKPVCNQCTVHCYEPETRARIQQVMRYAGPRMMWTHPVLALRHFIHSRRQ